MNIFYLGVQNFAEIDFSTYQQGIELTWFFFQHGLIIIHICMVFSNVHDLA